MQKLPENGASMADAARTREYESEHICDSCDKDYHECNCQPEMCARVLCDEAVDLAVKVRKERDP